MAGTLVMAASGLATASTGGVTGPAVASAAAADSCPEGQSPQFVYRFADLKARLADWMGYATTCMIQDSNGSEDVQQRTTTGLAYWRKSTDTVIFTNGPDHWALHAGELVYWNGTSMDPPAGGAVAAPDHPCVAMNACPPINPLPTAPAVLASLPTPVGPTPQPTIPIAVAGAGTGNEPGPPSSPGATPDIPGATPGVPSATPTVSGVDQTATKDVARGVGQALLGQLGYGGEGSGLCQCISAPATASNLTGVVEVAAGGSHSLARTQSGEVWAWGENRAGQIGTGDNLGDAGASGQTRHHTPVKVNGVSNARQIGAGTAGSMALLSDGSVMAWGTYPGNGAESSLSPVRVSNLSGVQAIAFGDYFSMALRSDGTVWTWGSNDFGQLGDGTTTNRLSPGQVQGLAGVTAIAAGGHHGLAIKSDGTLWAWGWNRDGELGDGTSTNRPNPVQVSGMTGVKSIAGGEYFSLAAKSDGTVWGWGSNAYGQIASAPTSSCVIDACRTTPYQIPGLSSIASVAAGASHSLALTQNGQVYAWGFNQYGQLGRGTSGSSQATNPDPQIIDKLGLATQIDGGLYHTMVTVSDTTLVTN